MPKTDGPVWEVMSKGSQIADNTVQKALTMLSAGISAMLAIINKIGYDRNNTEKAVDCLSTLTDVVHLMIMAFNMNNQARKEIIRNNLQWPIAKFCGPEVQVGTETLFVELNKKLAERDTTKSKLTKKFAYK